MLKKLIISLLMIFSISFAFAQNLAVISLHGKWGAPPGPLEMQLNRSGIKVVSLEMPWSSRRLYDVTYSDALAEIHKSVTMLKSEGAKKVVLAGHSFGANAALAYTKEYSDVDGLILYAPGHVPEIWFPKGKGSTSVTKARDAIKSGRPDEIIEFEDFNSGNRSQNFKRRADIFLSYFDPDGLGNMPLSATQQKRNIPVLCVMSSEDRRGENYLWNKLPPNPSSRYIETNASHLGTPDSMLSETLEFLKGI